MRNEPLSQPSPPDLADLGVFPTATIHEALGRIGALPGALKPVAAAMRLYGPAFTVAAVAGSNLALHHALAQARPGDVVIASVGGAPEFGYWGEIMATAARHRGLGGLVIDACVRDADLIEEIGFPVFARGLCIRGTSKAQGGALGGTITIGDIDIHPGDAVIGDRDGVVVVPQARIAEALTQSRAREDKEEQVLKDLAGGRTTLEIYDLPDMT